MDCPHKSLPNLAIFFLLILAAISAAIWSSSISTRSFKCHKSSRAGEGDGVDELEAALRGAATAERTVIITVVNRAYTEEAEAVGGVGTMLDLFLEGFWWGEGTRRLLPHLLVVAVDGAAYERCRFRRLRCFRLETEGVEFGAEKVYMSDDFIKMMWRRTQFLGEVLRRGYSFVFTDADVLWLRDPFPILGTHGGPDLQISMDRVWAGRQPERNKFINTGFYFVRSTPRTAALFRLWYASRHRFPGQKEQDVLMELMRRGVFQNLSLPLRRLDTRRFSGFCQDSRDAAAVVTVHANCCRTISAKVSDLTAVLRTWARLRRPTPDRGTGGVPLSWPPRHVACSHSWATRTNSTEQ